MSFDDYANHIYQKHRLAIALAVIKSKPSHVPTAKYLEELKSKIADKMDDDDITVCSDDFLIVDDDEMNDSATILKDFDPENLRDGDNGFQSLGVSDDRVNTASEKQFNVSEDLSQTTYYDSSQTQFTPNNVDPGISNITIYKENHNPNQNLDAEQSVPKNIVGSNEPHAKIRHYNTVGNKTTYKITSDTFDNKQSNTEIRDSNRKPVEYESYPADKDATYYDSQKTVPYSVHGFTENYTHYSPSQSDIIIPNKYIYGVKGNRNDSTVQKKDKNEQNNTIGSDDHSKMIYSQNINEFTGETQFVSKDDCSISKMDDKPSNNEEFEYSQTMNMFSQNNDNNFNKIHDDLGNNNIHFNGDSDRTMINTNQDNEHIENTNIQNSTQYSQNVGDYFEEMQNIEDGTTKNSFPIKYNAKEHNSELTDMEVTTEPFGYNQNFDSFSQNVVSENEFDKEKTIGDINKPINEDLTKTKDKNKFSNDVTSNLKTQDSKTNYDLTKITEFSEQNNDREEFKITEEEFVSEDIISYKVLEEFNKVKTFLSRSHRRMSCDGYSTDSGYRSDSQLRNSNRSALQLSGNWLNQSGCCLFNYIIQCPILTNTRDITNEIAQVLSQLIDRLHEEEKYPSFLENLLETVDVLLRQVYDGDSTGDSEFLKKDESIHRVLLLNKSIHIQKHSIEKLSNILETFHSKVTETDSTYELTNIDQIENISYIFHLLEILIKKYLKNKDSLSQLSQDEDLNKVFKKSSITEIWRKKWNPSLTVFEGSREKKCVLKTCSDILNKIVVDCVSGYSLVAYSALKCFNSMQT